MHIGSTQYSSAPSYYAYIVMLIVVYYQVLVCFLLAVWLKPSIFVCEVGIGSACGLCGRLTVHLQAGSD